MTADEYLSLLKQRLTASYNVEMPRRLDGIVYPLYARSQVVVGQYILHKSITYEHMETNEHVLCRVVSHVPSPQDISSFADELKRISSELVKPSYDHMSSAVTGVLVAESGFGDGATRQIARSGFTQHFRLGLQGWCFLRLLGVDLSTGQVWANRRGKEVMRAYRPSQEG